MILKPISDFPGYSVSNLGFIQSDYRYTITTGRSNSPYPKEVKARILKPAMNGNGYQFVTLRKNNKPYTVTIHIIVAKEFHGPRPNGLVVHHRDNDKLNNNASNLEYTTRQKNTQEYFKAIGKRRGTVPVNHLHLIFMRIDNGESIFEIAKEYNVTRNDIATITRVIALTGNELQLNPPIK